MKLAKVTSFSNLISSKRGTEPATPSPRSARIAFEGKILDVSSSNGLRTPSTASTGDRMRRTPLGSSFVQNSNGGNSAGLSQGKSSGFFRIQKGKKDKSSPPLTGKTPVTPSSAQSVPYCKDSTPTYDYFEYGITVPVEPYGEHSISTPPPPPPPSPCLPLYELDPRSTPGIVTATLLKSFHNAHPDSHSKTSIPDVPVDAIEYEEELTEDLAEQTFTSSEAREGEVYLFKEFTESGQIELKPLMLVERVKGAQDASARYSFGAMSLSARHGISSSPYCF